MSERKWAMVKIGPGDWSLMSNDRRTLYRFTAYDEDGSATYGTTKRKVLGRRWYVRRYLAADLMRWGLDDAPNDDVVACLTRAEAVRWAEEDMA